GRQPRATATGDSHGRRGRATGPGDGAGRRGRATGSNSTAQKRGAGITGPFVTTRTTGSFVIIDSSDTDRATVLFVPPDTDVIIGIFATIVTIVTIVAVLVFVILVTIVATEIIVNS